MMKKILLLMLIFTFVFTFSPKTSALNAAPLFKIDVTPDNAGKDAQYRIYGSYCDYSGVSILKLYFRADTNFHSQLISSGKVLVNGISARGVSFNKLSDGTVEATIRLLKSLNKGDPLEIIFKEEAGLINPITPATCYFVRIVYTDSTGGELGTASTERYRIGLSAVSNTSVTVEPQVKGVNAEYSVFFITGAKGSLKANLEEIRIKFPPGTIFPSLLTSSKVLINGKLSSSIYRDNEDPYVLRVFSSFDIPARTPVGVLFKKEFGIKNTLTSGTYKIFVSTYVEPDWDESEPFIIVEPEVRDLKIEFRENFIGGNSDIKINFKTSNAGFLPKGGRIYVEFPEGFSVPNFSNLEAVKLNDKSVGFSFENNILTIVADESISQSQEVSIQITEAAMIVNPTVPGVYEILVYTDSDLNKSPCLVDIVPSTISDVSISALYSGFGIVNEFVISFRTGPVYTLNNGNDRIIVKFDEGFTVPGSFNQGCILVQGNASPSVVSDVYRLYVTTPVDILPNSPVEVKILECAGIKNPENLGEYGVSVSTTKETEEVESNKLKITPLPIVEFTINPPLADGQNGYYKTNPEVMLSTSNGVKVFYKIDEGEFSEFAQTFKMSEGTHFLYVYAVDSSGNKGDIVKKEFAVDTTPPEVKFNNTNSNPVFRGSPGKLTGSVSEPCTLKINEVILELKDNLNFEVELNVYEGMPIAIYARDLAGNASTLLLTAHIDSIPPLITFLNSVVKLQGLNINSIETTESTYTIKVKLNEKGKVFIGSNEMYFDGYAYSYSANLIDGDNQFIIKAIDSAGNETMETLVVKRVNEKKIVLQIGNTSALVGSETLTLEAAPIIEHNFTLVPLRFISESFGAQVQWNEELKVITIIYKNYTIQLQVGSTVGIVNNNIVKLDVPPKIINDRTLVPIRFISETFGAEVLWDNTTKTITITYKP